MNVAARVLPGPTLASWRRLKHRWARPWSLEASGWLVAAAGALLFLDSAGTVDVGFTLRPSDVLLGAASVVGLPWVLRGWARLPRILQVSAAALIAVYLLATIFGPATTRPGLARTSHRELVYLAYLLLGITTIGLVVGIRAGGWPLRRIVWALVAGLFVEAAYAAYQWPAQHYGWPLHDINNAPNSDNFTTGHRFQGNGLFGWERVRGTFKEPLVLGSYLASVAALAVAGLARARPRSRRARMAGLIVAIVALTLTSSSLTWGATTLVALLIATTWAVASGRPRPSTALGAVLAIAVLTAPLVFTHAEVASGITGRSAVGLQTTVLSRRDAWQEVGRQWAPQPVLGHGPGQSSVLMAYRPDVPGAPVVLGSAYGVWGSALLDAGIAGLAAWILLLGSLFALALRALLRGVRPLAWGAVSAAAIAVILGDTFGDRFDPKVWLLLGVMAATCERAGRQAGGGRQEPDRPAH